MTTTPRWPRRLFAFALVFQLLVASYGIAQEVRWGHYGFHTGEYGSAALHFRRHGTFVLSTANDWERPTRAQLNFHHPYLLHQYIAVSQSLFGEKPWVMRLPNALISFVALAGLWSFVRRARGEPTAALATLFFALNPLHGCYCFLPEYQLWAITWVLWAGVGWLEAWRSPSPRAGPIALFLVCTALVGMTDWPWYFVALVFFLNACWQLRPGAAFASGQTPRKLLALRGVMAAFAFVVLATFVQHLVVARLFGEFGQASGSFAHRTGLMHASILVPLLVQRFGLLHATVLPLVAVYWFVDALRKRRTDPASLFLGSVFFGAVLDTAVFRWGFAYHEYRTYWYVAPFAFFAADCAQRTAAWLSARAETGRAPALLRDRALRVTAGALAVVMLGFTVPMVVLCRMRGGSVTMWDYDEKLPDMLLARAARAAAAPGAVVGMGASIDGRLELRWLANGPQRTINSSSDVTALHGQRLVVALDRFLPFGSDSAWRPLVTRGRLLVVGDSALLVTTPDGSSSVEVAHAVRRGRRGLLSAWLHGSWQGPPTLERGTPEEMVAKAQSLRASFPVVQNARAGLTPLLDSLPRDLEANSTR